MTFVGKPSESPGARKGSIISLGVLYEMMRNLVVFVKQFLNQCSKIFIYGKKLAFGLQMNSVALSFDSP